MRELTQRELEVVAGSGWASWIVPLVVGAITGGPVGIGIAAAGIIANTGVDNLQHLHENRQVPTMGQIFKR